MKTTFLTFVILIFISFQSSAQVKLWKNKKTVKTKGYYTIIDTLNRPEANNNQNNTLSLFKESPQNDSLASAAMVIPIAASFIDYGMKALTKRKEQLYTAESSSLNALKIPVRYFYDGAAYFEVNQYFFPNKEVSKENLLGKYRFKIEPKNNSLVISLDENNSTLNYSTVKLKTKYDLAFTTIDFTINAEINKQKTNPKKIQVVETITNTYESPDQTQPKLTEKKVVETKTEEKKNIINESEVKALGTKSLKIITINNEISTNHNVGNLVYVLPNSSSEENLELLNFIINVKISTINPYGTTTSPLNDFFEKNSDANKSLLEYLLGKKE